MTYYVSILMTVNVLSLFAAEWQTGPSLTVARGGASAVKWNNYIYIFGGKSHNNIVLNSVERFNISTGNWEPGSVPDFSLARYNATAVVFEDKIYLMGGRNNDRVLDNVELYDPALNQWQPAQKLRRDREGLAGAVFNNRIYAIGGQRDNYDLVDEIEWFNKDDNDWYDAIFNLPYPRAAHFSAVVQDTFYMFGGSYFGLTASSYKAVPGSSGYTWIQNPALSAGRAYGATTVIGDQIYLLGGETSTGKTDLVEVYNTSGGSFRQHTDLPIALSGAAAAGVGDTIYIFGGFSEDNDEALASLYYLVTSPTAVLGDTPDVPNSDLLISGYPNPFNGRINFRLNIPATDQYQLNIFDIQGKLIAPVYSGQLRRGEHTFSWNAHSGISGNVASGLYFLIVTSPQYTENLKMIYVK